MQNWNEQFDLLVISRTPLILVRSREEERLETLLTGIKGEGQDVEFLKRWEYNNEQKAAITESIYSVAEH